MKSKTPTGNLSRRRCGCYWVFICIPTSMVSPKTTRTIYFILRFTVTVKIAVSVANGISDAAIPVEGFPLSSDGLLSLVEWSLPSPEEVPPLEVSLSLDVVLPLSLGAASELSSVGLLSLDVVSALSSIDGLSSSLDVSSELSLSFGMEV